MTSHYDLKQIDIMTFDLPGQGGQKLKNQLQPTLFKSNIWDF